MAEPWVVAGVRASCLTIPLGSLTVIKAWLHTSGEQGQRLVRKRGILQGKSFSLTQYGGAKVVAYCMGPYLTSSYPITLVLHSSTSFLLGILLFCRLQYVLPSTPLTFVFTISNSCHSYSCAFPPLPTSLPPSSMNAFFLSKPYLYLLII